MSSQKEISETKQEDKCIDMVSDEAAESDASTEMFSSEDSQNSDNTEIFDTDMKVHLRKCDRCRLDQSMLFMNARKCCGCQRTFLICDFCLPLENKS